MIYLFTMEFVWWSDQIRRGVHTNVSVDSHKGLCSASLITTRLIWCVDCDTCIINTFVRTGVTTWQSWMCEAAGHFSLSSLFISLLCTEKRIEALVSLCVSWNSFYFIFSSWNWMYYSGARHRLSEFQLLDSVCFFLWLANEDKGTCRICIKLLTGEEHVNLSHCPRVE